MNADDLSAVARALRHFKVHPSRNTPEYFRDVLPEREREIWLERARRLLTHMAQDGLTITKSRWKL